MSEANNIFFVLSLKDFFKINLKFITMTIFRQYFLYFFFFFYSFKIDLLLFLKFTVCVGSTPRLRTSLGLLSQEFLVFTFNHFPARSY